MIRHAATVAAALAVLLGGVLAGVALGGPTGPDGLYDPTAFPGAVPEGYRQLLERDQIAPVYEPQLVAADAVGWDEDILVIGVAHRDEARAYPVGFLNAREMVLDEIDGTPVVVSWCPVCATAMVHERVVDGEEIVFGNQGALYRNAMTWWDHDTGSVWSQALGEAILGPWQGERVELMSSRLTKWGVWLEDHPDSLALDAPGSRSGFTLRLMSVAVEVDGDAAAYPTKEVQAAGGAVNDRVGGQPVAVMVDPELRERWGVFSREVDGQVVTLSLEGRALVDPATGSRWDAVSGAPLSGPLAVDALERVAAFTIFAEEFGDLWPDGRVWEGAS